VNPDAIQAKSISDTSETINAEEAPAVPTVARIVPESSLEVVSATPPLLRGSPLQWTALVTSPPIIAGVRSWTIETIGPRGQPLSMSFSPDGSLLAASSNEGVIRIWDSMSRNLLRCLVRHTSSCFSIAWSTDGAYLASGGLDRQILIWDVQSGRQRANLGEQKAEV
jgi:WD40 repeat protein